MENKPEFPDKKIDKLLYEYFDARIKEVSSRYPFSDAPMNIHDGYLSPHGNALLNVACALVIAMISLFGLIFNAGASPLGETVNDFIYANNFDAKIPNILEHLYKLDVFKK